MHAAFMHAQARRGCTSVLQGMMIIFAQRLVMPLVSGCAGCARRHRRGHRLVVEAAGGGHIRCPHGPPSLLPMTLAAGGGQKNRAPLTPDQRVLRLVVTAASMAGPRPAKNPEVPTF
jgi:hypothetical protein